MLRPAAPRIATLAAGLALAAALVTGCDREPDLVGEHLRQGDTALSEGRYAQAIAAYAHAHELSPASARVQRSMMWARVSLMADDPARVAPESLEDVVYEAELLRKLSGGDGAREAVCLAALGNARARRGDLKGARTKLEEAVRADPSSAIAHAALGAVLLERRETSGGARASFEKALQIDAGAVRALVGLGQIELAAGDAEGAAKRFEAAIARRDDLAALLGLGEARLQQGKHAEATLALERALALEPRSAEALGALGRALLGAGRLEEAEHALRAANALRQDEGTTIALGYALARLKRSEEALAAFGQVLSSNASAAPALYGAGVANEDLGRTDQALEFYRRVLALPGGGAQQPLVAELQKEARGRVAALSVSPNGTAGADPAAGAAGTGTGAVPGTTARPGRGTGAAPGTTGVVPAGPTGAAPPGRAPAPGR